MGTTNMPTNIQYNSPMPIYSRETAEEQYKQQVGEEPNQEIKGVTDRHFDPSRSETLKAIRAEENDNFGKSFDKIIAEAEAPHIPASEEPQWTHTARNIKGRVRSATPPARLTTPSLPYYAAPSYSTLQHPKKSGELQRSNYMNKSGYDFGGLDFVDRSRIPQKTTSYGYYDDTLRRSEEPKVPLGYEMGGTDFGRGETPLEGGIYHGHGPEKPKLQSHFQPQALRQRELNIEEAPNVNNVSADILVGDTLSNQHIAKDDHPPDHSFGTSFGPTIGFQNVHRTKSREQEPLQPATFSLSARDLAAQKNREHENMTGNFHSQNDHHNRSESMHNRSWHMTSQSQLDTTNDHLSSISQNQPNELWVRSRSAAPVERYQFGVNERDQKEVTIQTLLDDRAIIARKKSETPQWHERSLEKHNQWKNRSDPRLFRPQISENEPYWSRIVSEKRNAWEEKARTTDERVQMSPTSKKMPQQPPYWYTKANQTHSLWQSVADQQHKQDYYDLPQNQPTMDRNRGGYINEERNSDFDNSIQQSSQKSSDVHRSFVSHAEYGKEYGGQEGTERSPVNYESTHYNKQQTNVSSERHVPIIKTTPHNLSNLPSVKKTPIAQYQTSSWQSQRAPRAAEQANSSSNVQYEHWRLDEKSRENLREPARAIVSPPYNIEKTSYQQKTHHETKQPYTTVTTNVTKGSGAFNRETEMAEVLERGIVANTEANMEGNYKDKNGQEVQYKRNLVTSVNPNSESTLLKEEEKRVIETPLEPGVISRHVTTKYYKKRTITDTTTTTTTPSFSH